MERKLIKVMFLLFISLILSISIYALLLAVTTWKNSSLEISCEQTFSNGIWRADNPWNLIFGSQYSGDYNYLNCDCGLFGDPKLDKNNSNGVECVYYEKGWINNRGECHAAGFYFEEFNSGGKIEGICLCTFDQRENSSTDCLLDLAWRDYQKDREKKLWSRNEIGGLFLPHIISFVVIYVIISAFALVFFVLSSSVRKPANPQKSST